MVPHRLHGRPHGAGPGGPGRGRACTEHRPLGELIDLYQKNFDVQEKGHLLYSLAYFEAEGERMPKMLWDARWPEMREPIEGWVRELAKG